MLATVLVVATRACLDARAAFREADKAPVGGPFRLVGGVRRGWINYSWPAGQLQVGTEGIVISGPAFNLPASWDVIEDAQLVRAILGWGVRFRIAHQSPAVIFWLRRRTYADRVLIALREHEVAIKPGSPLVI